MWRNFVCGIFGRCRIGPKANSDRLIDKMATSVAETRAVKEELRELRESGIWPQDLIRGTYRTNQRKVRRGTP